MEQPGQADGFVILCNTHGVVLDVPFQTLPTDRPLVPGVPFAFLFHGNSIEKAFSFLASAREEGVSEHCSLNMSLAGQVMPVFLSAHQSHDGLRILGALSEASLKRLCETSPESAPGLLPANATPLREMPGPPATIPLPVDVDLIDELSRLNNEFANAQRDLAKANAEINAQREWLHGTLLSITDAVIATDQTGRIKFMNPTAERLTQWTEEQATGRPLHDVFMILTEEMREDVDDPIEALKVATGQADIGEKTYILLARDASEFQIEGETAGITGLSGNSGDLIGTVIVFRDVTERKRTEQALKSLALVDELTGLYNRRGFMALAEQQMKIAQRFAMEVTVFFADLDGLKRINDTLGHQSGDEAISAAATLLRRCFRQSDIVARFGGDEFAVLAVGSRKDTVDPMGPRLQSLIDEWNAEPGRAFSLSISLGTSSSDATHPFTLDELLEQADQLMYHNKKKRRQVLPR